MLKQWAVVEGTTVWLVSANTRDDVIKMGALSMKFIADVGGCEEGVGDVCCAKEMKESVKTGVKGIVVG